MQDKRINILITRPLEDLLLKEAAQKGIDIDVLSFIETESIRSITVKQEIENAAAQPAVVVFTSMNAVESVMNTLNGIRPDWSIYCMGNTTQKLVSDYFGASSIKGTAADAAELATLIAADRFIDELFFFCGDIRKDELPAILKQQDIEVKEIIVYKTTLVPHKIDKNYGGILFFSPSAAMSFFNTNVLPQSTTLFAIGKTTAAEIKKHSGNNIIIGDEPGKENLLKKMTEYFKMSDVGM